mmetsp:Transcript_4594/g.6442  ORF Transcript_4594/g.6442 Transcript_4594/m.6442 type:complete len:209 (-) Transcript_4594:8-634(-)
MPTYRTTSSLLALDRDHHLRTASSAGHLWVRSLHLCDGSDTLCLSPCGCCDGSVDRIPKARDFQSADRRFGLLCLLVISCFLGFDTRKESVGGLYVEADGFLRADLHLDDVLPEGMSLEEFFDFPHTLLNVFFCSLTITRFELAILDSTTCNEAMDFVLKAHREVLPRKLLLEGEVEGAVLVVNLWVATGSVGLAGGEEGDWALDLST